MKHIKYSLLLLSAVSISKANSFEDINNLFNKIGAVGDALDADRKFFQ